MADERRTGVVTLGGRPVTLLGPDLEVGAPAPDFRVVDADFQPVSLSDFAGRTVLVSAVPSLDTEVCALQTKRFNEEAGRLGEGVAVLTISQDLPFAQKRFCAAEQVSRVRVLSDHVWRDFGLKYGVLIEENALLARSVFVVSPGGLLSYREIVPEVTEHPDYDRALEAVRSLAG